MEFNFESSEILYLGAAFLGTAAIITFGSGTSLLSPVTKLVIMALMFVGFLAFGTHNINNFVKGLSYGLAAVTYLTSTWYLLSKFNLGTDAGFLALLISAAIFAGLGYLITDRGVTVSERRMFAITAVIVLLAMAVTLFDFNGSQPSYVTNLDNQVNITENEEVTVGSLIAQNDFVLPRNIEVPRYEACVYAPEKIETTGINIDKPYDYNVIGGNTVENFDMNIRVYNRSPDEESQDLGTFTVEKADECPQSADQKKVVIVQQEDRT